MSKPGKPEVRPSASSAEIAKRKDAVRFAIANTEIEGLTVSPEAMALLDRWAIPKGVCRLIATRRVGGDGAMEMPGKVKKADFPTSHVRRYLEPGPIVLVSSAHAGRTNIMTMGWHTVMEFTPSLVV